MTRAEQLGILGVVLHPGAHMDSGEEAGIARIAAGLNKAHAATSGFKTLTLVETTAGQGTALGYKFEQLKGMLDGTHAPERVGFCLDTCHIFVAGYEIRTPETYAATMAEFDRLLGLERLKCFHFNDTKKPLGSRVDRHDAIGTGELGLAPFGFFLNDPRFAQTPMILETPKSEDMHEDVENLENSPRADREVIESESTAGFRSRRSAAGESCRSGGDRPSAHAGSSCARPPRPVKHPQTRSWPRHRCADLGSRKQSSHVTSTSCISPRPRLATSAASASTPSTRFVR